MAKPKSTSQRAGLTQGKLVLIGVLAVVLAVVMYIQFGGSEAQPPAASVADVPAEQPAPRVAAPPPLSKALAEAAPAASSAALSESDQKLWKSPELDTVVQHDPFALPAAFPQPPHVAAGSSATAAAAAAGSDASQLTETVDRLQKDLEELRQRGVRVIVRERDQYVAMVGYRTIHVGDEINGFTVTAIAPDGVRVERKVQP